MVGSDEHYSRSRRPDADDWGWSSISRVLDGWMIEMLDDAVCDLHRT
jgi:hypothetical protein